MPRAWGPYTRRTIGIERRRRERLRRRRCFWERRRSRISTAGGVSFQPQALRSESSTVRRVRIPSAIPMRRAGSGCSSTGMRRAGKASSPIPRSRRSFKQPGTRLGHRLRSSPANSTASTFPRAGWRRSKGGSARKLPHASRAASRADRARAGRRFAHLDRDRRNIVEDSTPSVDPIKVGVITDQTGPLSFMGLANANVAKMVIGDINASGGLLGRQVDLHLEDSATKDSVAQAKATKLIEHDHVDVIFGGIYSSTRQAIKGPAVVNGKKLYIYPEQYEGQECDPLIFCTGPVPAQQVEPLIPWLMQKTGATKFYLPSADYIWPRTLNRKVREVA